MAPNCSVHSPAAGINGWRIEPRALLLVAALLRASQPCSLLFSAPPLLCTSPGALGAFPPWGQPQAQPRSPGSTQSSTWLHAGTRIPFFFFLLPQLVCTALRLQAWHLGSCIRVPPAPAPCCSAQLTAVSREGVAQVAHPIPLLQTRGVYGLEAPEDDNFMACQPPAGSLIPGGSAGLCPQLPDGCGWRGAGRTWRCRSWSTAGDGFCPLLLLLCGAGMVGGSARGAQVPSSLLRLQAKEE